MLGLYLHNIFSKLGISMDERPNAIKKRSRNKLAIWPHVTKGKSKKKMAK